MRFPARLTRGLRRGLDALRALLRLLRRLLLRRARGRWLRGTVRHPKGGLSYAPWARPWRHYRLYLPADADRRGPRPLVVMLHGCTQTPKAFAKGTRMNRLADEHGFLALYPAQRRLANPYRCWNWFDPAVLRGDGEAAIVVAMVREILSRYPADPARVYLVGISAGGALAGALANCYGAMFAACAIHSGVMYRAASSPAEGARTMRKGSKVSPTESAKAGCRAAGDGAAFVPTLVLHGRNDETAHPANADQIAAQMLALHGQLAPDDGPVEADLTARDEGGRRCQVEDYRVGERLLVRKIVVDGLGHAWSGGDARQPYNDPEGPDATRMMWRFLSGFRRQAAPELVNSER